MDNGDEDKEFEKFLMESMTGSEITTPGRSDGHGTGRKLEWNLTSSEDMSPRKSNRFLKTEEIPEMKSGFLGNMIESSLESGEGTKNSPNSVNVSRELVQTDVDARNEMFKNTPFISSSLTETNITETDDRQEFANRLAQQNSALQSLGKTDPLIVKTQDVDKGTLEGLEEMRDAIDVIKSETQNDSNKKENEISFISNKSDSVYSDASKTEASDLSESVASPSTSSLSLSTESQKQDKLDNLSLTQESASILEQANLTTSAITDDNSKVQDQSVKDIQSADENNQPSDHINNQKSVNNSPLDLSGILKTAINDHSENESSYANDFSSLKHSSVNNSISEDKNNVENEPIEITGTKTIDNKDSKERIDVFFDKKDEILLDDDSVDLGKTRDLSLAESSLVEMLNIYESKKTERSIEDEFIPHMSAPIPQLDRFITEDNVVNVENVTFKKPKDVSNKIKSKKKGALPEAKKHKLNKTTDWSHVKSSGYGPISAKISEQRPKISPRVHAKVESAKKERLARLANKRLLDSEKENRPIPVTSDMDHKLIETLKMEIEQERNIRLQLETQYKSEITKNREKEVDHRNEIVRILSTHQMPSEQPISGKHENVLIQGYKSENERLYCRTKELESEIKMLNSKCQAKFSNNEAVIRLENMLENEENMRREIEKTARDLKISLHNEQKSSATVTEMYTNVKAEFDQLQMHNNSLTAELKEKLKMEVEMKNEIEYWKQISNQSSIREENEIATQIREIEKTKNKEIKKLKSEIEDFRKNRPKFNQRPSSSSSSVQTDTYTFEPKYSTASSPKKLSKDLQQTRTKLETTLNERNSFQQKLLEAEKNLINSQIEMERAQLQKQKMENENENLKKIQLDYNQTCRQLESYQSIQSEKDALENYYREALQDRAVYESRSIEAEELLTRAQTEIDKRHEVILKLHDNSTHIIRDYKNLELQKKYLEIEVQNLQFEIEQVRQASVPENVARISAKLADMEKERQKRENELRQSLLSGDPQAHHVISDQTNLIHQLKSQLNAKNNLYAKSQSQLKEMKSTLEQLKTQVKNSQLIFQ